MPEEMPEHLRRMLNEFYAEFNQELADLVNDERFLWHQQ